ncbi:MAG: glycosyltransferase [Hyphomicrobiales bacterium]|nr:glycosyltransferase [Hyphomicrobiales bacterium]
MPARVLLMASAVGPFGAGVTGGVSLFARNSIKALQQDGTEVTLLAPEGTALDSIAVETVDGAFQPSAASLDRPAEFKVPPDGLLAAMLDRARRMQDRFDAIVNLNHDWLPLYLTPFFATPLLHVPNLSQSSQATDRAIAALARERPGHVAALSRVQAEALGLDDPPILPFGLDLDRYRFDPDGGPDLAWAGRISPEKGLSDAAEIAARHRCTLAVAGSVEDAGYWQEVQARHGDRLRYVGFLETDAFQAFLGRARALLQTQTWVEAFGVVTLEALACGTPVVAYAKGANAEIVQDGITGRLVPPNDVAAAVDALADSGGLSRQACRDYVAGRYDLGALAAAYRGWLKLVSVG